MWEGFFLLSHFAASRIYTEVVRRLLLVCFLLLSASAQGPKASTTVTLAREPQPSGEVGRTLQTLPAGVAVGLMVRDVQTGKVLLSQAADRPLIPASTIKLVTAASVLYDRGGNTGWWSTELTVPAAEAGKTSVSGLTLRGSGDPTLSVSEGPNSLRSLAEQAYRRGLRQVEAVRVDVLPLDATSFEQTELGLSMPAARLVEWESRPPTSATEARRRIGNTLIAELRRAGVQVKSEEIGSAKAYRPYTPPPRQDDKGRPLAPDLLIPMAARPEQGIASVRSASPFGYLASTLRPSDNFRAETLLASLAVRPGETGTLDSALKRERAILQRMGLDVSGAILRDGSGLDRGNRLSPRLLTDLLKLMYDLPYPLETQQRQLPGDLYRTRHNAFVEALPQAGTGEERPQKDGRGGTLAHRMVGSGLDVRAKTGTLPGVSGLAGYVTAKSGRVLAFSMLMNGPDDSPILTLRALQDELVAEIAQQF